MIVKGCQVFAVSPPTLDNVDVAKDFIKQMGLTADDVKLIRTEGYIAVVALHDDIPLKEYIYGLRQQE